MKSISIFTRTVMLLMCILLLGACASTPPPPTAQATSTAISLPTPTPYVPPPTLTPPPLGPVPQNCPLGPTPQQVFSDIGPVLGHAPLWVTGIDGPHATVRFSPLFTYTQHGWEWKLLWRMPASYTHSVTLHGGNLRDGIPLWFEIESEAPSTAPVLNPLERDSSNGTNWIEWGSYVDIPMAGCYYLEAAWPGGSWRITFAAGNVFR